MKTLRKLLLSAVLAMLCILPAFADAAVPPAMDSVDMVLVAIAGVIVIAAIVLIVFLKRRNRK